ncbi:MAG: hypothetical protein KGN00_12175, partial [Chloroflexota bacterium]|nr:hypothetical protein [Chloroflexota bacterium]
SPSTGNGSSFSTTFSSAGNYTISLHACNSGTCGDGSQFIPVSAPPPTQAPATLPPPTQAPVTAPPAPTPRYDCSGMPSKTDINPATGKQYAVNPATGVWDDNYWANIVEPQLKSQYCHWVY